MNKADFVKEWFEIASTDLRTAEHLFETMRPKPLEIICYHCQQAAEKALKGFLADHETEPPHTHDLEKLRLMCMEYDRSFESIQAPCLKLRGYSVSTRYPGRVEVEEQDAVFTLKEAERIRAFCADLISEPRQSQEQEQEQEQEPAPTQNPQQSM
jgi:HEPN domain-containing protein